MIDAEDFQLLGASTPTNKLGIANPHALAAAVTECSSRRLAELQASPIRGGFDASHLQEIHRYLYQDVFDWAGELRRIEKGGAPTPDLENALNRIFDRLSRENLLKGLDKGEWLRRASDHTEELRSLHPFLAGNDLAIQEFATELARKNNLQLEWREEPEAAIDAVVFAEQAERSAQLRRLIMLVVDADPAAPITRLHHAFERGNELSLSFHDPRS
jgi:cell filamentation protein